MKKFYLISAILAIGALFFYFRSNYSRSKGKAEITYPNKQERMTRVTVWGPMGYHYLDWTITPAHEHIKASITGKGMSQFRMFGHGGERNNYMHHNQLNLEKINQMLQRMEPEQAYLIWASDFKTAQAPSRKYLMISKHPELYNNNPELIKIAQKAVRPE